MKKHEKSMAGMFSFHTGKQNRFTLIELLIVVAIIAILAAMLLPALGKARKRALTMQCLNQQKQLGTFFQMYSGEYNGWFPGQHGSGYATCWAYILYEAGVTEFNDLAKLKHWTCPIVYGLNGTPVWTATFALARADRYGRMTEIKHPSQWVWVSEAYRGDWKAVSPTISGSTARAGVGTFALFHENQGNITFFDGHAGTFTPQNVRTSNSYVPYFAANPANYFPITDVYRMFDLKNFVLLNP